MEPIIISQGMIVCSLLVKEKFVVLLVYENLFSARAYKNVQSTNLISYLIFIIIIEAMLSCLIYFTLTFLIPIRLTYYTLKQTNAQDAQHWCSYWAFYSIVLLIKSCLTFLTYQPMELGLLLFHLWLYSEQYRGALFLRKLIVEKVEQLQLDQHVKQLGTTLSFLHLLESKSQAQESEVSDKKID